MPLVVGGIALIAIALLLMRREPTAGRDWYWIGLSLGIMGVVASGFGLALVALS